MDHVPRRLYLAGPMSGYPEHNFPLFHSVAAQLRRRGHDVFNPAENKDGGTLQPRAFYMRLDIPALLESDGVVLLPGWRTSRGANLEVWLAIDLGMPIYQCVAVEGTVALEGVAGLDLPSLPFDHNTERLSPPVTQ
jgi:nucleoside 2-deoxyribosyltransferase